MRPDNKTTFGFNILHTLCRAASLLTLLAYTDALYAQTDPVFITTVKVQMKGLKAERAILGYNYGAFLYKADSTDIDTSTGSFTFRTKGLKPGVHFVTVPQGMLFTFMIDRVGTVYELHGNVEHPDSLRAFNSAENTAYLEFSKKRRDKSAEIEQLKYMFDLVKQATKDPAVLQEHTARIARQYQSLDTLEQTHIDRYPHTLYAKMLNASRIAAPPANIKLLDKQGNPSRNYVQWLRQHYWDQTDFSDERLLHGNDWPQFFDDFFNRWTSPVSDSIIVAIDAFMQKAPKDSPLFHFAFERLIKRFDESDRPGADRVLVHLADHYMPDKAQSGFDEATLERIRYKAEVHRTLLTGSIAPPLTLRDERDTLVRLHSIRAPITLLIFYSPLCDHCTEALPGLHDTWLKYKDKGVKALAINTDDQLRHWKNYVAQTKRQWINVADPNPEKSWIKTYNAYNLPVLMLLDRSKKVLWKRVPIKELDSTLERMTTAPPAATTAPAAKIANKPSGKPAAKPAAKGKQ
jgi:peroxiredoxin